VEEKKQTKKSTKSKLDDLKRQMDLGSDKDSKSTIIDKPVKQPKVTDKQLKFVEEYVIDFNATQAAIRAGYSEATAASAGYKLMNMPHIIILINEQKKELSVKLNITRESILNDLENIKNANSLENPNSALKAIEMQIKMLGLNEPEKIETKITGLNINDMIKFK